MGNRFKDTTMPVIATLAVQDLLGIIEMPVIMSVTLFLVVLGIVLHTLSQLGSN